MNIRLDNNSVVSMLVCAVL